ncbi:MAG TPA: MarR family transcriptional regulator [Verrucomicrobiae bacterium]|jgi:DNA-binding MarR family transcriptional regulator|nr:MarR family transcriptional regulator [Verrucomicrobiae bacterium]
MKPVSPSRPAHYQALLQLLRTADILWSASRVFFARWELSPSQFNVLNLLSDQTAGLSQIELGRLLITHRSNVTGLIDRLEKRGLVARKEAAGDRRAYRIVLTNAGRKLLNQVLPEFHALANSIWSNTSAARATQLSSELSALAANAEKKSQPKGPS